MLKQPILPSIHKGVTFTNQIYVFASATLISFLLQVQRVDAQVSIFPQNKETTSITSLDSLIAGPYTQEIKKQLLAERLPEIIRETCSKTSITVQDLFCKGPISNELVFPNITYSKFVARKYQCDQERKANKEDFCRILGPLGYNPIQTYILYQEISWLTHNRSLPHISTLTPDYFLLLINIAERYAIDPKDALREWLNKIRGPQIAGKPTQFPPPRLPKDPFRTAPQVEKTTYGSTTIDVMRYDRQTAANLLTSWGYSIWSTNRQHEENGKRLEPGFTSAEGATEGLLSGLKTLIELISKKKGAPAHLILNGLSEGIGHEMGSDITGGYFNPQMPLLPKHAKVHGAGYTVDIRLSTEDALYLKTFFPGKSGKKQYGNSIYLYDYHGSGPSLHLHMNIFDEVTYKKLFSNQ